LEDFSLSSALEVEEGPADGWSGAVRRPFCPALKHILPEQLILSSDFGFGREGISRRHAFYKMAAIVRGGNILRKELGIPEAVCPAEDPRFNLVDAE